MLLWSLSVASLAGKQMGCVRRVGSRAQGHTCYRRRQMKPPRGWCTWAGESLHTGSFSSPGPELSYCQALAALCEETASLVLSLPHARTMKGK